MSEPSLVRTLGNRCPLCGRGRVFTGFLKMSSSCSECRFQYEQEEGQYLGAALLSYVIGAAIALPIFAAMLFHRASTPVAIAVPTGVLLVLSPFTFRYSRLGWLYVMCVLRRPTR